VSHAVLEAYQTPPFVTETEFGTDEPRVLLLSAPQEKRLLGDIKALGEWIARHGRAFPLSSVAYTLATRRGHHGFRAAFIVAATPKPTS
jgi:6-methylsalicylic acid synthase